MRTPKSVNATQFRAPGALDKVDVEVLRRDDVGMFAFVDVPGERVAVFVQMNERDCSREFIVVLHDVCEVRNCFHSLTCDDSVLSHR